MGFLVSGSRGAVSGFGFRVSGFGFWVLGFGFRVLDAENQVSDSLGCMGGGIREMDNNKPFVLIRKANFHGVSLRSVEAPGALRPVSLSVH